MTGISNWRRGRLNNDPSSVKRIHLIGICGTAMASLAGMLQAKGYQVAGSDQSVYPPMSTFLERLGIQLFEGFCRETPGSHDPIWSWLAMSFRAAIQRWNRRSMKRFAMLRWRKCSRSFSFAASGQLWFPEPTEKPPRRLCLPGCSKSAGLDPSFLVGGIAENFGSSFKLGKSDLFVIEGDEYDTAFFDKGPKFLHYLPERVILNNCEFDHADIYADFEAVKTSFRRLINIIPSRGKLIAGLGRRCRSRAEQQGILSG